MAPGIFSEPIEIYLARLAVRAPQLPAVLEEMHAEATRRNFPIIGPEVGRFFRQLAAIHKPRRILELGSGFGYSAVWWKLGSRETEIHLTDYKGSNLEQAEAFLSAAGVGESVHFHAGDALRKAMALHGMFDLIFCDIDKEDYPAAVSFAEQRLVRGGLLLFDNMLWHGRVALPQEDWDRQTEAVVETTNALYASTRWECSLIPLRDGVLMARFLG